MPPVQLADLIAAGGARVVRRARVGEGFIQPAFNIGFGDAELAKSGRNADPGAQVTNRLNS